MTKPFLFALALATAVATSTDAQSFSTQVNDPVLEDALVKFKEVRELPGKEAGVLVQLKVKEGDLVHKGDQIGQVDDSEPQMQKKVADYARTAAYERAKDEVEIKFATAQAAVTKADYEMLVHTNEIARKAVTDVELRRGKLDWDRALLAIEKATHEQKLAKFEYYTKNAEFDAADMAIKRRAVVSPLDGEIIRIYREQDEWVNPGDPILRLAQRDMMRVEGAVEKSAYDQSELQGCPVTVEFKSARGQIESVSGQVVYVSPEVRIDGKFLVRAEVANPQRNNIWLLSDGQTAKMTIHVNKRGAAAPAVSRVP